MVKIYYNLLSAPSRATLLTLKALNLNAELIKVDLSIGEHLKQDFIQKNSSHTVPTLEEDNGFILWDSHSINTYLVDKYAEGNLLYPKDLEKRSIINQRLHFDSFIFNARNAAIVSAIIRDGVTIVPREKEISLIDAYNQLEKLLEKSKYVAGGELTIADFSLVNSVLAANVILPVASNRYPKMVEWLALMEELPYYKETLQEGVDMFTGLIKNKLIKKYLT